MILSVVILALVMFFVVLAWWFRDTLRLLKTEISTNVHIALGLLQVISLLHQVLDITFPHNYGVSLNYAAMVTADLHNLVSLDCHGWDWYARWILASVGLPAIGLGLVAVFLGLQLYRDRQQQQDHRSELERGNGGEGEGDDSTPSIQLRDSASLNQDVRCSTSLNQYEGYTEVMTHARANAWGTSTSAAFFVVMLLYPRVSNSIFSALRCRILGPEYSVQNTLTTLSVLEDDYSVNCHDPRYRRYFIGAWLLVFIWPIGIPVTLFAWLMLTQ
jgi:hypothetical protein